MRLTINNRSVVLTLTTTFHCSSTFISKKNKDNKSICHSTFRKQCDAFLCLMRRALIRLLTGARSPGDPAWPVSALRGLVASLASERGPEHGAPVTHAGPVVTVTSHQGRGTGTLRVSRHYHILVSHIWATVGKYLARQLSQTTETENNQVDICNSIRDVRVLLLVQTGVEMEI